MTARKDMEALIREAQRQGWRTQKTRAGHWRLYSPDGVGIVHLSGTPGSASAIHRAAASMRKYGFVWKGR